MRLGGEFGFLIMIFIAPALTLARRNGAVTRGDCKAAIPGLDAAQRRFMVAPHRVIAFPKYSSFASALCWQAIRRPLFDRLVVWSWFYQAFVVKQPLYG